MAWVCGRHHMYDGVLGTVTMRQTLQHVSDEQVLRRCLRGQSAVRKHGGAGRVGQIALWCVAVVLGWTGIVAAATEVTTCGQVVKGSAFLSGDLDCSSFAGDAVVINGGTLDLRGFTVTGNSAPLACGVRCTRSCKVISDPVGGAITGATNDAGICDDDEDADIARSIRVIGVALTGNSSGVSTDEAALVVVDSTITNHSGVGAEATSFTRGRLRIVNSIIANSGRGFFATRSALVRDSVIDGNVFFGGAANDRLTVKDSQITSNGGFGLRGAEKNRIIDSTISGNVAEGILLDLSSERLRVIRSTIDANGSDGVFTDGARTLIRDSTITNNGGNGIDHGLNLPPLKLVATTVSGNAFHGVVVTGFSDCDLTAVGSAFSGNGTDLACGATQSCADVASCVSPKLSATTCDTSYDTNSGFPGTSWGVCSLD